MILRSARHTDQLDKITTFYTQVLNLENLGGFQDHESYNGVFLGKKGENWHLEFTSSDEKAEHHFDEDDILVFYPTTKKAFDEILQNIREHQIKKHTPKNPYWERNGILIKDPDGYHIVISHLKI